MLQAISCTEVPHQDSMQIDVEKKNLPANCININH